MKHDIDRLMEERGIDAAVIVGAIKGNPTMYYMVNGAALSHAIVIRKRGEDAVLLCGSMEREEAEASGLKIVDMAKYDYMKILKDAGGDRLRAQVEFYRTILDEFGVTGRVAFYGLNDVGAYHAFLGALGEAVPGITIVGEYDDNVFLTARMTKGPEEIARIREAGRKTCEIVTHMIDFLTGHRVDGDTLMKADGTPLTIGDCKSEIRIEIARRGLIEEVGTIFAIGRDAGIPHSRGTDTDPIRTGRTIVFDIFPQEEGGGYFFDMTRTFVIGAAPDEVREAYAQLEEFQDTVTAALRAGEEASVYQTMTCDFMEAHGHETPRTNPQVRNGYVHSLGHGIGLNVHEKPTLSTAAGNEDVLEPGSVFTVEPGIYYPDKGWGLRIEDVYCVNEDGTLENLTNYPRELEIRPRG